MKRPSEIDIKLPHFLVKFVSELRRREVISVVVTYAVVGWLILQIAELTFEPLGVPDWGIRLLIILTIAGFPAVFFLAWLIDLKTEGIMFDLPLWPTPQQIDQPPTKSAQLVAIVMSMAVLAGTIALTVYLHQTLPKPESKEEAQAPLLDVPMANSIAVLAFENFDGDTQTDYFAAGLAEEILNFLARARELNVAARTSSFRFKGEQIDIREVAKLLNVKHVLEGSVRREGNRIRVNAKLIDGEQGFQSWSAYYERDLEGIFALQQELAAAVVNELSIVLSVDSVNQLNDTPSENIDAYIYYLEGRERLRSSRDSDVLQTAKQLFSQAINIDPNYARAYAGLCEVNLGLYEDSNSINDFENAELACEKAISLNVNLTSEVKVALGRLYRFRGWYEQSIDQIKQAIDRLPTSPDAFIELGESYLAQGDTQAAKNALLRAVDLKRNYWKAHEALANYYYVTEQYVLSAQTYEVVTKLAPDLAIGFGGKGAAYWMSGDIEQALTSYESSLALKPSRQALTNLGSSYYYAGQFQKAIEMQQRAIDLAPDDHRVWGRLAESYRHAGNNDERALAAYQKATELATANLAINEEDWLTKARLGLYKAFSQQVDDGIDLLEAAIKQSGRNPEVLYYFALVELVDGNSEGAIDLLEETVLSDSSYRQFIALDPDVKALQGNPRFQALLENKEGVKLQIQGTNDK